MPARRLKDDAYLKLQIPRQKVGEFESIVGEVPMHLAFLLQKRSMMAEVEYTFWGTRAEMQQLYQEIARRTPMGMN